MLFFAPSFPLAMPRRMPRKSKKQHENPRWPARRRCPRQSQRGVTEEGTKVSIMRPVAGSQRREKGSQHRHRQARSSALTQQLGGQRHDGTLRLLALAELGVPRNRWDVMIPQAAPRGGAAASACH